MKSSHLTHCAAALAAGVVLLLALGVQGGTLVSLAVILACPLMMVMMMWGMGRGHGGHGGHGAGEHQERTR